MFLKSLVFEFSWFGESLRIKILHIHITINLWSLYAYLISSGFCEDVMIHFWVEAYLILNCSITIYSYRLKKNTELKNEEIQTEELKRKLLESCSTSVGTVKVLECMRIL